MLKYLVAAALVALPGYAAAASAPGTASAYIMLPLTATETASLSFAKNTPVTAPTAVTVNPDGSYNAGLSSFVGTPHQATFAIQGEPNANIQLSVDPVIFLAGPGSNTLQTSLTLGATNVVLDASGNGTVNVGGSFALTPTKQAGSYSGNFTVTATYQ